MAGHFAELTKRAFETLQTIEHIIASTGDTGDDETEIIEQPQEKFAPQAQDWLDKIQSHGDITLQKIALETGQALHSVNTKKDKTLMTIENAKHNALFHIKQASTAEHNQGYSSDQEEHK